MFKDQYGLITENEFGNIEASSFARTVDFFVKQRKQGKEDLEIKESLDSALKLMDCGQGVYKKHPNYPHPSMDRSDRSVMDKTQINSIIRYYRITNQNNKIKEIQSSMRFGVSYNNTGKANTRMSIFDILFMIYFYLLTLIGLK